MITDLSIVITGGLVKRRLGQVDLETGELLKGVAVWVPVKRSPYANGFIMANQEALLTLAQDKEITGECYRVLFVLLTELDYENYIYIPQKEIGKKLGIRPQNVHRAVKVLLQKGILLSNERGYRLNHNYGWKGNVRKLELVKNRSEVDK
jgi:biotin operon repressor